MSVIMDTWANIKERGKIRSIMVNYQTFAQWDFELSLVRRFTIIRDVKMKLARSRAYAI